MTTPAVPDQPRRQPHRWSIAEDPAGLYPVCAGTATTHSAAWFAALDAGLDALLEGTIRDLAIAVDEELPSLLYSPGRDARGRLDAIHVAEDLVLESMFSGDWPC